MSTKQIKQMFLMSKEEDTYHFKEKEKEKKKIYKTSSLQLPRLKKIRRTCLCELDLAGLCNIKCKQRNSRQKVFCKRGPGACSFP